MLLAARMHCAIAGVSNGTPTMFIAYSAKAKGMARYVYGTDKWCIDLQSLNQPETTSSIHNLLDDRAGIRSYLFGARQKFKQDALKAGRLLADRMSELE
jgi:polysaccharide pyruvyl transferase WcaK-like protein